MRHGYDARIRVGDGSEQSQRMGPENSRAGSDLEGKLARKTRREEVEGDILPGSGRYWIVPKQRGTLQLGEP